MLGEGSKYSATVQLPQNIVGTATITITAETNEGSEALGPAYDTVASFDYNTTPVDTQVSGELCSLSIDADEFEHTLGIQKADFSGPMELIKIGNYIYLSVGIRNFDITTFTIDQIVSVRRRQASAALYRIDVTDCSSSLLKLYQSVTLGPRSLVEHQNRCYLFEGTHYAYLNEGLAYTDASYTAEDKYQHFTRRLDGVDLDWKSKIGFLKSISNSESELSNHGINWISADPTDNPAYDGSDPSNTAEDVKVLILDDVYYSIDFSRDTPEIVKIDEPPDNKYGIHGGTASPMISVDDDIYMVTGYGDLIRSVDFRNDSQDLNASDVSRFDNWHQIKYGKKHIFRSYDLKTNNRTYYDVFNEFAKETYSSFYFINDKFHFKPRDPMHVVLSNWTTNPDNTIDITFTQPNYDLSSYPDSADISINGEIISYDRINRTDNQLSLITRSLYDTSEAVHAVDSRIYWVDHIIQLNSDTINNIIQKVDKDNDIQNIRNHITIEYGNSVPYVTTDEDSIDRYGERKLVLSTNINKNEIAKVKWLANNLKYRYSKLHSILTADLELSLYIIVKYKNMLTPLL